MLSMGTSLLRNSWARLEETIGIAQIQLANTVINENIEKEKALSAMDDMERHLFCVSIDTGWNNRGSGKSYNSDSCHHITVGNRSGLVVALHYMSKRCGICERKKKQVIKVLTRSRMRNKITNKITTMPTCVLTITLANPKVWKAPGL